MLRLGAHVSISGGYEKAVDRELELGGNCGQIFPGSPRGWKVTQPKDEEIKKFKNKSKQGDVKPWLVHSTYLINLATPKNGLAKKSFRAIQEEINTAGKLGAPYYVFHPGAHTGAGERKGIQNIAKRLSKLNIPDGTKVLLENTAGKGTTLGQTFEQLHQMVQLSDYGYSKLGICLDTCHLYAGGYDFTSEDGLNEILQNLDEVVGMDNLHYLHLNDSKHPLGSKKDEHEHIGMGEIGEGGFRLFINNPKLRDKPMVLETPVDEKGFKWNIRKIKELRE